MGKKKKNRTDGVLSLAIFLFICVGVAVKNEEKDFFVPLCLCG